MTEKMRVFLESIVTLNRAQIRQLERQIKNINGLLYVEETSDTYTDGLHSGTLGVNIYGFWS
ncbi:hypothetical protein LCGC14_2923890, partial [marine sediment metagenome]